MRNWMKTLVNLGGIPADYISFYKMNETSGTTLNDETGSNDGTIVGGLTSVTGYTGNALSFDGTANYCTLPTTAMPSGDMTASLWIYIPAGAKTGSQFVLSQTMSGDTAATRGFIVSAAEFRYFDRNTVETNFVVTEARPADDTWHNVIMRRSGSEMEMWLNGSSSGTTTITGTPATSWDEVTIAARANDSGGGAPTYDLEFEGYLDQIRIYDRALSDTEIAELAAE